MEGRWVGAQLREAFLCRPHQAGTELAPGGLTQPLSKVSFLHRPPQFLSLLASVTPA